VEREALSPWGFWICHVVFRPKSPLPVTVGAKEDGAYAFRKVQVYEVITVMVFSTFVAGSRSNLNRLVSWFPLIDDCLFMSMSPKDKVTVTPQQGLTLVAILIVQPIERMMHQSNE
jgi:hypothetical protein